MSWINTSYYHVKLSTVGIFFIITNECDRVQAVSSPHLLVSIIYANRKTMITPSGCGKHVVFFYNHPIKITAIIKPFLYKVAKTRHMIRCKIWFKGNNLGAVVSVQIDECPNRWVLIAVLNLLLGFPYQHLNVLFSSYEYTVYKLTLLN